MGESTNQSNIELYVDEMWFTNIEQIRQYFHII